MKGGNHTLQFWEDHDYNTWTSSWHPSFMPQHKNLTQEPHTCVTWGLIKTILWEVYACGSKLFFRCCLEDGWCYQLLHKCCSLPCLFMISPINHTSCFFFITAHTKHQHFSLYFKMRHECKDGMRTEVEYSFNRIQQTCIYFYIINNQKDWIQVGQYSLSVSINRIKIW